ncbi:MAG: NAD(P)/FAD-dependent oxidoreductase [Ruminococcus sp.]|uniref:NAD(P)/FAD-dependent oxidoreductase n=1 Tax=Ruminococcus sp. TaxID=41978 RepID=UPI0025F64C73|nr:NAD(P)/FAD-dependent oxidoreductase [Ruminococcus sp.]MBO4865897.1 NAD(P)/FAD-dependent oxidoreductase [Ruminococcus sp.]
MPTKKYDAVIVGGGAAGLFCGAQLATLGKSTVIIEKNERFGRKLRITGKGRCNVTNNCDVETVMKNIPRNNRFMYSSLSRFTPEDAMAFFEGIGVPLKTERGNRVFPVSDSAHDIADALVKFCLDCGAELVSGEVTSLIIEDGCAVGVKCGDKEYRGGSVIIATGGRSYPKTGSDGFGYKLAKSAGHHVTPITPSLCPIVTEESEECAEMMGLSLKNCTLSLREDNSTKPLYEELGEMLFTHFGLSGPLVLSASAHIRDIEKHGYHIDIDLKPALSNEQLDARILRDFSDFPNREFGNSLGKLLPAKMITVIVARSGIPSEKRVNQITRDERRSLVEVIKKLTFKVKRLRPIDEAIITRGGVELSEIDPKTMQSKLCNNLYFIGEILDLDAYTGGFNLQIAWSTAYACAQAIEYTE